MSLKFLSLSAFAVVFLSATPVCTFVMKAQQQNGVRPITSLPLPPADDDNPASAAAPPLTVSAQPLPDPATAPPPAKPAVTAPEVIAPGVIASPPPSAPAPPAAPAAASTKPPATANPPAPSPAPAAETVSATAPVTAPAAATPQPVNADRAPVAPIAPVSTDAMPAATERAASPVTLPAPIPPAPEETPSAAASSTVTTPINAADAAPSTVRHAPIRPVAPVITSTKSRAVNAPTTVTMPAPIVVDSDGNASFVTAPATDAPTPSLRSRSSVVSKPTTINLSAPSTDTTVKSGVVAPAAAAPAPAAEALPPPPPGTLGRILFRGAEPYTQPELASLTGLVIGTRPTNDSLQAASQRLINSGLFANVSASYDTPHDVGTATFVLQPFPSTLLRQASFANIVWLSPEELSAALAQVPLYHGYLAATGGQQMIDSIQVALNHALAAKGVRATITHEDVAPSVLHPYDAVEFRVIDPNVVLGTASLFDIPPALVTKSLRIEAIATKQPYNEGIAGTTLADILLAPERETGYVGARLWHIERKRRMVGSTVYVDFTARVDPGPIYTVRTVGWTPTAVLSDADFRRVAVLKAGQSPTADAAAKTEQAILNAYYAQGYIEANVTATTQLDAPSGVADYVYSVVAGPQYHLRTVTAEGLSPEAKKDFETSWNLKPGDVYNEPYLLNFLNAHQNVPSFRGYVFSYNRAASTDTHDVDLTLVFRKG